MDNFLQYMLDASKYVLILLSLLIIIRCICSMLSERYEPEVWGYIRFVDKTLPIYHWENLIGRARSCDIRINSRSVGRIHAVLRRRDDGEWRIYNVFSQSEVWVNGEKAGPKGLVLKHGDAVNLGGCPVRFMDITAKQREALESRRVYGRRLSPFWTLIELSCFQLVLLFQHVITADKSALSTIALGFAALICIQWACYHAMRLMERTGFEVETIAFYLSTLGMSIAASSTPEDVYKQIILTLVSVALFMLLGWWLRSVRRSAAMRIPFGVLALMLLALNVLAGDVSYGARNWLEIGGFSFQPSEFVKVLYIYVGASTLDKLYGRKNLFAFIAFSAVCVMALALIGDFGTALIFFVCFLVISFMRSGSIATVFLAISGAGLAGFLAVTVKPHIARRFATWGHAWEDVYDAGFQQTRAMSAAASGGLFGKGAGAGWLKDVFAANTDMVFALTCEELGLIVGLCMVMAVLTLAFFAMRSVRFGRSAYYSIAACAAVSILLSQLALNVFGSLDMLPFTGVTFPFVSRGGSSLMSCWMLMAYIKAADNRQDASFVVSRVKKFKTSEYDVAIQEIRDHAEDIFSQGTVEAPMRFYTFDAEGDFSGSVAEDDEYSECYDDDYEDYFESYGDDDGCDEWEVWRP